MKAGTTVFHRLHFPGLDFALVESMIITYSARKNNGIIMQRRFPEDIVWLDGVPCIPLTQENTLKIWEAISPDHMAAVETQINFIGGAVGKTNTAYIRICSTLYTELVAGNAPDSEIRDIDIRFLTDDVVAVVRGYNIGRGLKLDEATNTLSVDTADEVEAGNTLPITAAAVSEAIKDLKENGIPAGGLNITDDGDGNVTITASAGVSITDDGNGNVVIA